MAYIVIEYQDGIHQYDSNYNPITTWNDKYCAWIINEEYENDNIDWQAEDDEYGITEFPRGITLAEAKGMEPDTDN